ncbi:MAG: penicillin-binding transpeptidase domain-containing protein, partial [Actinomycetes bacterium]
MNRPLRRLALVVLLMMGALLINVNYLQAVAAGSYANKPGNVRTIYDEYALQRGPIIVDGAPIAESVKTSGRLTYLRTYANGPMYAPVTGFYSLVYGTSGIEAAENSILSGSSSNLFVSRLRDLLTGQAPRGGSVTLTLNAAAQKAAYDGLAGRAGAVVAIQPSTGAILALASSPSYNPNLLSSHDPQSITKAWQSLQVDPSNPMLDRPLTRTYPPGSTFKIVTTAALLASGRFTPTTPVPGPAALPLPGTSITLPNEDKQPCTPGQTMTTMAQAFRFSCNATYGYMAMKVGWQAIYHQASAFGFGHSWMIPMASAPSVFPQNLNLPQTAQSAIGQFDTAATALQMAVTTAAIANHGTVMNPYLVSQVQGPDLAILSRTQPSVYDQATTPQIAAEITDMMV